LGRHPGAYEFVQAQERQKIIKQLEIAYASGVEPHLIFKNSDGKKSAPVFVAAWPKDQIVNHIKANLKQL